MAEETNDDKKKRAGKRFTYSRAAQCDVDGEMLEVQMLNISASGVQFATRTRIVSKNPIKILWRDSQFGSFDPTLIIAREVHKPENPDFQFYYGSQYYNLSKDVKQNLLVLLKHFKEADKKTNQQQIEIITPQHLFDIIEQGSSFLRRIFNDGEKFPYFDNVIKEIGDYEKAAFIEEDPVSLCIQKLTTHNFHCNLLGILAPIIAEKQGMSNIYFQYVLSQLQKIVVVENEVEEVMRALMENKAIGDEDKKATQKKVNESSNRLFYTKQGLLQSIVETFSNIDADSMEFKDTLGKIKEQYEKILEFSNPALKYETLTYKRRTKNAEDFSKPEAIVDVPIMSEKQPPYFIILCGFIILIFVGSYIISKIGNITQRSKLQDEIGLDIDIKDDKRFGTQLDLTFSSEDWAKLSEKQKFEIYSKISQYIRKQKGLMSSLIFDDQKMFIQSVFKDSVLTENTVPAETPTQNSEEIKDPSASETPTPQEDTAPEKNTAPELIPPE